MIHEDILPQAINPAEILPPVESGEPDGATKDWPRLTPIISALNVAQSGILSVDDVAAVLRCSVDTVRRIPFDELASYDGPGRGVLYRMEDVQKYLLRRKRYQKRRSGLDQRITHRPDPHAGGRNKAKEALKSLPKGTAA